MRTVLAEVGGFTPLIDHLIEDPEVGLMGAVLFGRVWRYCQGSYGVCSASKETLAEQLGLSRMTIIRHLQRLCALGYLEDITPDLRNKPHTYRDTGKIMVSIKFGVTESDTGVSQSDSSVSESYTGVTESDSHCNRELHEDRIKKELRKREENLVDDLWPKFLNTLQQTIGRDVYQTHFADCKPVAIQGDTLQIRCRASSRVWIQRLNGALEAALYQASGRNLALEVLDE